MPSCIFGHDFSGLLPLLGSRDAVMVAAPGGEVLFSHNAGKPLIPASTLKLLTALAAFHYLGQEFRFVTQFYLGPDSSLKIKGYGDPLLISEVVRGISKALETELKSHNRRLNDIILDNTFFRTPVSIPGVSGSSEPYDAPNGALCVNFNTINFKHDQGAYVSAEPQTPLLPMVRKGIEASGLQKGRITLSHEQDEITYYAGRLFKYFLEETGLRFTGKMKIGAVMAVDRLVFEYRSRYTLDQVVSKMLEYSNNFMANQIFIRIGADQLGAPGTLTKGVPAIMSYAEKELGLKHITISEGSGISRQNRFTADAMMKVLVAFEPFHTRMRKKGKAYFKSGHLKGVRTRVGYYRSGDKGLYRYVILLNTPGKSIYPVVDRLQRVLELSSK